MSNPGSESDGCLRALDLGREASESDGGNAPCGTGSSPFSVLSLSLRGGRKAARAQSDGHWRSVRPKRARRPEEPAAIVGD